MSLSSRTARVVVLEPVSSLMSVHGSRLLSSAHGGTRALVPAARVLPSAPTVDSRSRVGPDLELTLPQLRYPSLALGNGTEEVRVSRVSVIVEKTT